MMKRITISVLFAFLTLAFSFSLVQATTLLVRQDGSGDYDTLHSALLASVDGDEIVIGSGNWTQPVLTIAKDLVIRSENGVAMTILDGQMVDRLLHFTGGASCQISGLTLTRGYFNDGGAIHVDDASEVQFSD